MRQRVGNRTLNEPFGCDCERRVRLQVVVEAFERVEETRGLGVPRERRRIVPRLRAPRDRQRPVEQIADVRENRRRRSRRVADAEFREARRRAAYRLATAIGDGGNGVTQKSSLLIHGNRLLTLGLPTSDYRLLTITLQHVTAPSAF